MHLDSERAAFAKTGTSPEPLGDALPLVSPFDRQRLLRRDSKFRFLKKVEFESLKDVI